MSKKTTSVVSLKHYACKNCGHEKEIETNHFGECYSLGDYNQCPGCNDLTTWVCQAELPEEMQRPEKWTKVDITEIKFE